MKTLSIVAITAFAFLASANFASAQGEFQVTSENFDNNTKLKISQIFDRPRSFGAFVRNSCSLLGETGGNRSPQLSWFNAPPETASFAVMAFDMTAGVIHWGMYNIPPTTTSLPENAGVPGSSFGQQVVNFNDDQDYDGPCPPKGQPPGTPPCFNHNYVFTVYALSQRRLVFPPNANGVPGEDLQNALATLAPLATASITGIWSSTPTISTCPSTP